MAFFSGCRLPVIQIFIILQDDFLYYEVEHIIDLPRIPFLSGSNECAEGVYFCECGIISFWFVKRVIFDLLLSLRLSVKKVRSFFCDEGTQVIS